MRLFTYNPHDDGYDLVPGGDVTTARIGHVFLAAVGDGTRGLYATLDGIPSDDVSQPYEAEIDSGGEAAAWLAERGYELDERSITDINGLAETVARELIDARDYAGAARVLRAMAVPVGPEDFER